MTAGRDIVKNSVRVWEHAPVPRNKGQGMSWLDMYNLLLICTLIALVVVRAKG